MAYKFRTGDKSTKAGVRRIARERIDAALARAPELPDAGAVHAIRKETKKLRGLLRLVKPRFKGFRGADTALKRGARELGHLRDAQVRLATFDSLTPALNDPQSAAPIRRILAGDITQLSDPQRLSAGAEAMVDALSQLRGEVEGWKIRGHGFDALGDGVAVTWRRARRDMKGAELSFKGSFDAATFHDWRKSVKRHWYHAQLLQPFWPKVMAPHIAAADRLGEMLGAHNDLDVLAARLRHDLPEDLEPIARELTDLALKRRRQLAGDALVLGRRLFADKPRALEARWGRWWALWRG